MLRLLLWLVVDFWLSLATRFVRSCLLLLLLLLLVLVFVSLGAAES
jgi:hypothetical protein